MKIHDCEQGSAKWLALRAGIPTASQFNKILTPTGKPSKSAEPYMHALMAERMLGEPLISHVSWYMERGSVMESEARQYYEFQRDMEVKQVGLITNDAGSAGASPDGLVGEDGSLEIKCPSAEVHVGYLLFKPADRKYYPQIQGQLWISEREWVDVLSYYPGLPHALTRVERDEPYIKLLSAAVLALSDTLEREYTALIERIGNPEDAPEETITDVLRESLIQMNQEGVTE